MTAGQGRRVPGLALAILLPFAGCGSDAGSPSPAPTAAPSPRPYALGFTDFPHARTVEAASAALEVIRSDADLIVMHFDDGVPWDEAAAGGSYPPAYEALLRDKALAQPPGHVRYLAVTPIAFERDRLAARRGNDGSEPLLPPWDARSFDHPSVVQAFTTHCERMIATFDPDFFAYGIEANMLEVLAPEKWPAFVRLVRAVYSSLKGRHPSLPIFLTFQVDFLHADPGGQTLAIQEVLPYTDLLAASSYPFSDDPDPTRLSADHFEALAALAPDKPFAVAETAWPGEDVTAPYPTFIPSNEENQRLYVERLLSDADRLWAAFVCWFFTRDYDEWWESEIRFLPNAPLLRLWKDTGLYRGDGSPRPALETWRAALARPRG
jgi:hypothetical protein